MAITSEEIWDVTPAIPTRPGDDTFVLGEPFRRDGLPYEIDLSAALRRATKGFFDERDPGISVGATLAKLAGVVGSLTVVALAITAALGLVIVLAFRAILG